jgi:multidrug efflux pump subunit AcrB
LRRRQGWWLGDSLAQGGQRKAEFFIFEHGVDELNDCAPILLQKMQALPKFADLASDQQRAGRTLKIEVNRDVASRLGVDPALVDFILYDAFASAPRGPYLYNLESILRDSRSRPRLPAGPERA